MFLYYIKHIRGGCINKIMHITIFEEKDFIRWCNNDLESYKESIIRRACSLLLSTTNKRKNINIYSIGETILFDNLDNIELNLDISEDFSKYYNTVLVDKCITVSYNEELIKSACINSDVSFDNVEYFLNKLFNFITDATIIEWKLFRGLPLPCIKVESSIMEEPGFFPVSYYTSDFIFVIESLTGKRIKFTTDDTVYANVTKENIICYFTTERLESEYIICEQLAEIYLQIKGFETVDKMYFTQMKKWKYNESTLNLAMHIILQNKFINLLISDEYPIYNNSALYSWLNFKESECYMSNVLEYLCSYSKKNKLCKHCSGLDDFSCMGDDCPLYKEDSVLDKHFTLEELSTPKKHSVIVDELIENFILS